MGAGRVAGGVVALLALVSCTEEAGPATGAADPLAEKLEQAAEIAAADWDKPWILDLVSSRYTPDGDELTLDDRAYVFVSDDGAASYYLVRFYADGAVGTAPVAGLGDVRLEPFDFAENSLTSTDALDLAWERVGESLVERCGPLRWLDVLGTRDAEGEQAWRVEYRIGAELHLVWLDATTGALGTVDEQPC